MRLAKTIEVRRASWTSQEVNRACSYNSISLQGVLIKRKCLKRKSFGQFKKNPHESYKWEFRKSIAPSLNLPTDHVSVNILSKRLAKAKRPGCPRRLTKNICAGQRQASAWARWLLHSSV
jgi:hypothetical protein